MEQIEPWGEKRADYRAAVVCWVIASWNYGGKGRRPQLKDYLKLFDFETKAEQTDEELAALFNMMTKKSKK